MFIQPNPSSVAIHDLRPCFFLDLNQGCLVSLRRLIKWVPISWLSTPYILPSLYSMGKPILILILELLSQVTEVGALIVLVKFIIACSATP